MRIGNHHQKQITHFGKEFSEIKKYELSPWQVSYIKKIKKYLLDKKFKGKTLVDVGCGSGYVAIEMARLGLKVIACDITPEAIENLKNYKKKYDLKNLTLILCPAEKIPIAKSSVDYVVANAILEHIPNEKKAIFEWKKILKARGKIFITTPIKYKYIWPFFWPINFVYDRIKGHLRRYDLPTIERKFKLKATSYFYTGHEIKMMATVVKELLRVRNFFDDAFEKLDKIQEKKEYGSSNIIAILEKES